MPGSFSNEDMLVKFLVGPDPRVLHGQYSNLQRVKEGPYFLNVWVTKLQFANVFFHTLLFLGLILYISNNTWLLLFCMNITLQHWFLEIKELRKSDYPFLLWSLHCWIIMSVNKSELLSENSSARCYTYKTAKKKNKTSWIC